MKPAIFLDRDGTINKLNGLITNAADIKIIEGAAEAIKIFNSLEFLVLVVTNQPVIARAEIDHDTLIGFHELISDNLLEMGARIDNFFYCPHYPTKVVPSQIEKLTFACNCRKPNIGLIEQAQKMYNISMNESWVIGDSWRDENLAKNANLKYFRIDESVESETTVSSLLDAAYRIRALKLEK